MAAASPPSIIRVKLPPSRPVISLPSASSQQQHDLSSLPLSFSTSKQVKQEVKKTVESSIPSSVPLTPRKNNTSRRNRYSPARRHGGRRVKASNQVDEQASPAPSKNTPSKTRSLISPSSSGENVKKTAESFNKKQKATFPPPPPRLVFTPSSRHVNHVKEVKAQPFRRKNERKSPLSKTSKTINLLKKEDDPFKYRDPLLSTAAANAVTSPFSSANVRNSDPNDGEQADQPSSSSLAFASSFSKSSCKSEEAVKVDLRGEEVDEESFDGWTITKGFDDSGCDFEWEGTRYFYRYFLISLLSKSRTSLTRTYYCFLPRYPPIFPACSVTLRLLLSPFTVSFSYEQVHPLPEEHAPPHSRPRSSRAPQLRVSDVHRLITLPRMVLLLWTMSSILLPLDLSRTLFYSTKAFLRSTSCIPAPECKMKPYLNNMTITLKLQ